MINLKLKTLLVILAGLFALGACGQKGPLYLPGGPNDPNAQAVVPAAEEGDGDQAESEQDDEAQQATE